jgi:hypothetical protein
VNRRLIGRACAVHYRPDVAGIFGTHGRHGIMFRLPEDLRSARGLRIEMIADNGYPVGNRSFRYVNGRHHDDYPYASTDRCGPMKLFLHVPKTGGTALLSRIRRSFSHTERLLIYPDPPGIPRNWVSSLTEGQMRQFKCIYGHFFFGLHEEIAVDCRYSTVLRHPFTRVISHYFHYQRAGLARPGNVPSWNTGHSEAPFEPFGAPPSEEFDNLMVRMLSGQHPALGKVTQRHLYRAIRNLERHFDCVGVMEDANNMHNLQSYFGIPGDIEKENVGTYDAAAFQSPAWAAHLAGTNAYDLELYRYAAEGLSPRLYRSAITG